MKTRQVKGVWFKASSAAAGRADLSGGTPLAPLIIREFFSLRRTCAAEKAGDLNVRIPQQHFCWPGPGSWGILGYPQQDSAQRE
jgi:hypothetical protein